MYTGLDSSPTVEYYICINYFIEPSKKFCFITYADNTIISSTPDFSAHEENGNVQVDTPLLKIDNINIDRVHEFNILGLTINERLH